MITDSINNLYTMLKTHELDLAIVEGRVPDPSIHYLLLDTDYLVLAVSTNHPPLPAAAWSLSTSLRRSA